jgi:hypothetical protein
LAVARRNAVARQLMMVRKGFQHRQSADRRRQIGSAVVAMAVDADLGVRAAVIVL